MAAPSQTELVSLLSRPSEGLDREYKSWLSLGDNIGRAKLAKAAIALANHGGGFIVLGMRPDNDDGGRLESQARPAELSRYSQEDINGAVSRYADPAFHCELFFEIHPLTNVEHAIVVVPGGMDTPVMSRRDCPGEIAQRRCYIRKSGPKSEEPHTAEEWRALLDRCVVAGRDRLLEAFRSVLAGQAGSVPTTNAMADLEQFIFESRERWQTLIAPLPPDHPSRKSHGYYEIAFEFVDVEAAATIAELNRRLRAADAIHYTGWGPFVMLSSEETRPRVAAGAIEAWLGGQLQEPFEDSAHSDYWRAHPEGRLFLLRGYDEDATRRWAAGTALDVTLPIWRIGEALLYAARVGAQFGKNPALVVQCRYVGLRRRRLDQFEGRYYVGTSRACHDDEVRLSTRTTVEEIESNLPEVLVQLLSPLYERFDFFQLPMEMVRSELDRLKRGRP